MREPSVVRATMTRFVSLFVCLTVGCASGRSSAAPAVGSMGPEAAVARARADSVRLPYTKADIDFMSGMISHHAQAIKMASWAPTHGASPALVRMAERIVVGQADEIELMQSWLRDRLQTVPEADPAGMKMKMGDVEHVMLMPGMLTDAQMKQLDAARGREFDRLFLTFMIQHHRGAIDMVRQLLSSHGAAQDETVFKFANEVEIDQSEEIQRMQLMLLEL